jgi:hypothetical protein
VNLVDPVGGESPKRKATRAIQWVPASPERERKPGKHMIWEPPQDRAVIAEVYPSLFRNRYPREGRTPDEQDAYAVARWLAEMGERGSLDRYFRPPLTEDEKHSAKLEGWILDVS